MFDYISEKKLLLNSSKIVVGIFKIDLIKIFVIPVVSFYRGLFLKWHFYNCDYHLWKSESPLEMLLHFENSKPLFVIKRSIKLGFSAFLKQDFSLEMFFALYS